MGLCFLIINKSDLTVLSSFLRPESNPPDSPLTLQDNQPQHCWFQEAEPTLQIPHSSPWRCQGHNLKATGLELGTAGLLQKFSVG